MSFCFTHSDVLSVAYCPYCAKSYCADCLSLHGSRQIVICNNCFSNISETLGKSSRRRKIYMVTGGLFGLMSLWYSLVNLKNADVNSMLFILVAIVCFGVMVVNIIRIHQIKEFFICVPYPK